MSLLPPPPNPHPTFFLLLRIICGLSQFTTKHHIARAALEAVCFQTREVSPVNRLVNCD